MWSGTAASWVDLHPVGALASAALGISDGQQVGYAYFVDNNHAVHWSATAVSWVNLNPMGAVGSAATGISGGQQAGYATFGNLTHAGMWNGTAESWVDLHAFLPAEFMSKIFMSRSFALGIWRDAHLTCVAGMGFNHLTNYWQALLWKYAVPPPPTGACCFNGVCSMVSEADCTGQGGVFGSIGSICANVQCPPPPCPADINQSGAVNVDDLLLVIALWGQCSNPVCVIGDIAPPGGNGWVNVDDLLTVINAWGPCP